MNRRLKRFLLGLRGPLLPIGEATAHLTVCGECGSHIVNPVDWHESDELHWWVRLRGGACDWVRETNLTQADAEQLERELAPGLAAIATIAAELERERMIGEVEVFIAALGRDLIGPADFARRF